MTEAEARLEALINAMQDGVIFIGMDDRIVVRNPAAENILSCLQTEGCGNVLSGCKDAVAGDLYDIAHLLKSSKLQFMKTELVAADRSFEVFADPVMDCDGYAGTVIILRDITEHKTAEKALKESEERFRSLIEASSDCVWEMDEEYVYTYIGPRVYDILGYKQQEVVGKSIFAFMSEDEAVFVSGALKRLVDSREPISLLENTVLHKDGHQVILQKNGMPFYDVNGNFSGYRGMDRDITARMRLEEQLLLSQKMEQEILETKNMELEEAYTELKSAQARILQQDKMLSIGQLAAGVAHEINNPMGFIISNLGTLKKYMSRFLEVIKMQSEALEGITEPGQTAGSGEQDGIEGLLKKIREYKKTVKLEYISEDVGNLLSESLDGAERVKGIVQDLRNFSRIDVSDYEMADINAGIDSTINMAWNELKYKVKLKKEYGDIPRTKCNLGQFNQVFINLLINAAHAIEDKGEVAVKTWFEGGYIYILFSDTGCGIPEDKIGRIFEPFFTTKEVGKGTGLGLSISYDIIKKHDGDIQVQSKVGEGTAFTIKIPVVEE